MPNMDDCPNDSFVDSQDLFQQTNISANTHKDIVCHEFGGFQCYLVDVKTCQYALTWWQ